MRVLSQLSPAILMMIGALFLSACKSAEERAEEHFEAAAALLEEGDVDRAIVELRNVFDLDGGHMGARMAMAELQLDRGNLPSAYRQYLVLAERYPEDLESRVMLSELAFNAQNWEELDRHGAQAAELGPDDPRVEAITLVREYRAAAREDDNETLRELGARANEMLEAQPENTMLRNIVMDDAIRRQEFSRALEEIDQLIEDNPGDSRYYRERLRVLAILGDMSAIESQLREMIDIFPDDPSHKSTLIRFLVGRGQIDSAENVLREMSEASGPEEPGPTVDLIRFLEVHRDTDAVRAEIEKAIAEHTDPVPFRVLQANLDFSMGQRTEAIATLQDVLSAAEPSNQTRNIKIILAKMFLASGNEVGARTQVEEVLAEEATDPDALKMQAAWQIEADDTDAAIGALRTALDQDPQDAETMTLMASAYTRAGQPELAKDLLAQAVTASGNAPAETLRYARLLVKEERYLPAEDILLNALRLDSSNIDLLIALADLYLRMEDFGRVESIVDTLRRIGGDTAVQAANGIEAERLNLQRGVDDAMAFLEDLANSSDADLSTRVALVTARLRTGDTDGALALAKELQQETPDSNVVNNVLAVAHTANGDLQAAEELYRDILDDNPAQPEIWRALARLQMQQGDREAAKALTDEALSHTPDNPDLLWAKASFQEQDGDVDGAIATYEKLYEMNSGSMVVANNLASLLATHRDDAESLDRAWTIARRLREADVPALMDTYGWIMHRRGSSEEALPYLETAAEGLPNDPIVQYHLGQVFVALERREDAIEQFKSVVDIAGPTDTRPQIETARTMIQELQNSDTTEN